MAQPLRTWAVAAAVLALTTAAVVWWLGGPAGLGAGDTHQPPAGAAAATAGTQVQPSPAQDVDNSFFARRRAITADGPADPLLVHGLRDTLEALLMEAGDASDPATLKQRLAALVNQHFPAALATRALALAERYVDYRVALGTLKAPRPDDPTALRNSLNARERLRERYFAPEEHEALFARESALDRYTLARLEIQHNTGLTAEEKARALKDAEAELPPEQRADRAHAVAHLGAAAQTQDFETRGVDDRTRYQLRSTTYGTDAAQALARLDQEERAWNQKLDDYAAAKAQAHDPGQMQALRERLFTPQEQLRLEAALALRQSQH